MIITFIVSNSEIFFDPWISLFHSSFQFREKNYLPNPQEKANLEKIDLIRRTMYQFSIFDSIHALVYRYIEWWWYVVWSSLPDCLVLLFFLFFSNFQSALHFFSLFSPQVNSILKSCKKKHILQKLKNFRY